jgi:hypothetical protein
VLSPVHPDSGNSEAFFFPHRLKQQRIDLLSPRIRRNVIRPLEEDRIDIRASATYEFWNLPRKG